MFSNCYFYLLVVSLFCFVKPNRGFTDLPLSEQKGQRTFSLQECIHLAQCNYKAVEIASLKIKGAIAQKNEMRSALLPQISLEGVWDNSNRSLSGDLTQFQDFKSTNALGLSIEQGLWDFGATWKRLKAFKLRIDAKEMEKKGVLLEVEELVKSAYYTVLEKEKILSVINTSLETLKIQLKKSQDLYEQGLATNSDVLAVEVQLGEKEKRSLQAKNEVLTARMQLNRLIGLELADQIILEDVQLEVWKYPYEEVIAHALCMRPDLLALKKHLESARIERKATRISYAPQFYAFSNSNYSSEQSSISAGIGMKMPLYEGGRREAKIDQLNAEYAEISAAIEDLNTLVTLEIRKSYLQLEETEKSFHLDAKTEALAEENLRKTIDLYEEGLLSIHDVLLVEEQLSFVRVNYFSNLYRYHMILAHLIHASGGVPFTRF